jgi:hypothetical protein
MRMERSATSLSAQWLALVYRDCSLGKLTDRDGGRVRAQQSDLGSHGEICGSGLMKICEQVEKTVETWFG